MKKKVLKIAKLLLVVLFVSYYCESSLFYHTHYFSWGVVTHSHPYLPAGSGTPGHNHTPVQCDTIAQLSMLLFVAGISLVSFFVPGVEVRFRPPVRHGRESSSVPLPQLFDFRAICPGAPCSRAARPFLFIKPYSSFVRLICERPESF